MLHATITFLVQLADFGAQNETSPDVFILVGRKLLFKTQNISMEPTSNKLRGL